jgi:hypothetical protein
MVKIEDIKREMSGSDKLAVIRYADEITFSEVKYLAVSAIVDLPSSRDLVTSVLISPHTTLSNHLIPCVRRHQACRLATAKKVSILGS